MLVIRMPLNAAEPQASFRAKLERGGVEVWSARSRISLVNQSATLQHSIQLPRESSPATKKSAAIPALGCYNQPPKGLLDQTENSGPSRILFVIGWLFRFIGMISGL